MLLHVQDTIPLSELERAIDWARRLPLTVDHDQDLRSYGVQLWPAVKAVAEDDPRASYVLAAWREKLRQDELRAARRSHFFGKVGDKKPTELELTVRRVKPMVGEWGRRTYYWFRHEDGRLVRWLQASGKPVPLEPGQRVRIRGRVKAHEAGGQEPITVLTYCEVLHVET